MNTTSWMCACGVILLLGGSWACQLEGESLNPTAQPGFLEFRLDGEPFRLPGSGARIRDTSFRDRKFFSCGAATVDGGNALIVSALEYESDLSVDCMPLRTYFCGDTLRYAAFIQWQGLDTTLFADQCEVVLTHCGEQLMSGVFSAALGDGRTLTGSFRDIEFELR